MKANRRIAFVISSQHLIPHGGIGQFAKGFCEMARAQNWIVDLILDRAPVAGEFLDYLETISGKTVYPRTPLSNQGHTRTFTFQDSYSLERMINFRESFMEAQQTNIYDLVIINTPEAVVPIYGLGIQDQLPIVFYTHNENMVFKSEKMFKGVFNDSFDEFFGAAISAPGIIVGTQSPLNLAELSKTYSGAKCLPMPLPETGLLEVYDGPRDGVLFIGRWEERKNPQEFIRVIQATGLPARVMTNTTGAAKFKAEFDRIGAKYDIRIQITGQEKCDFIRSSRVFYMPSRSESYGFALFETHAHVPSVVVAGYDWPDNFPRDRFHTAKAADVPALIKKLYAEEFVPDVSYIQDLHNGTAAPWKKMIEEFEPKYTSGKTANIALMDDIWYEDYILSLGRFASVDDVKSVYKNRNKFHIKYTEDGTWLSKTNQPPAKKESDVWTF